MHVSNYFRAAVAVGLLMDEMNDASYFSTAVAVRSMHVLLDMHPAGTFAHLCASEHKHTQFAKLFPLEIIYVSTENQYSGLPLCASRHKQSQFAKLFPLEIIYVSTENQYSGLPLCASRHKQSQFAKLFPLEIIYAHTLFNNLGISFITCTYFHLDDVSIELY